MASSFRIQRRGWLFAGAAILVAIFGTYAWWMLVPELGVVASTGETKAGESVEAEVGVSDRSGSAGDRAEAPLLSARSELKYVLDEDEKNLHIIRVVTVNEQPISGALVTSLSRKDRIGVTSMKGELLLTAEDFGSGQVAVMAEGFVVTEVKITPPFPDVVEVHLRNGSAVSGLVLDTEGDPVGKGMSVMAVSPLYWFDDRALEMTLSGSPLIPLVQTDEGGKFLLRGLEPTLQYRIFAAGLGAVSFDERNAITPGPDAYVELRALPVYGALLAFRDELGNMPPLAPLEGGWHGSARPRSHADWLYTTKWTAELLGLEPGCNGQIGFYDKYFFFTTHEDIGGSLALRYSGELPGFSPIDVGVDAARAIVCVPRYEISINQICNGFGNVTVAVNPPDRAASLLASLGTGRECRLRLTELSSKTIIEARLKSLAPAGFEVIRGVPYGDYAVMFVAPHQLFTYPKDVRMPLNLRVGPDDVAVNVSLPAFGTIEMKVITADGLDYNGPLTGSHLRTEGGELDTFHFSSAPYRIPLLPTGEYKIVVDNIFPGSTDLQSQTVYVGARDEMTLLKWRILR